MLPSTSILFSIALGSLAVQASPNSFGGNGAENARVSINTADRHYSGYYPSTIVTITKPTITTTIKTSTTKKPVILTKIATIYTTKFVHITTILCTRSGTQTPVVPTKSIEKRWASPSPETWDKMRTTSTNPATITKTSTLTKTTTQTINVSIYGNCSTSPSPGVTGPGTGTSTGTAGLPQTSTTECSPRYSRDVLIFDDFITTNQSIITFPQSTFIYKKFTFQDEWAINNCEKTPNPADTTCIPDTIPGAQFLSLFSAKGNTHPKWRRIVYDETNETTSFELVSFYVSTPPVDPSVGVNSIVYCGWTISEQQNESTPSWCRSILLSGVSPFLNKITLDAPKRNLSYIEIIGISGNHVIGFDSQARAAKGNDPIDFWVDNIEVCVPEVSIATEPIKLRAL